MIIIENYCSDYEHERYNSAALKDILDKNQNCILFCDRKHWENIKGIFDCYEQDYSTVKHVHVSTPKIKITSVVFFHNVITMLWIKLYLMTYRHDTRLITIFTATSGNILMARVLYNKCYVLIHMHAVASTLGKNVKFYNRIFHLKNYLKYCGRNIKLGCLSTWIYDTLSLQYGNDKFCNIGMAYWQCDAKARAKPLTKSKVRVGFIGAATNEKGGEILANLFAGRSINSVEFVHFSAHAIESLEDHRWPDVSYTGLFQFMEHVDLVIMPYDEDFYKYVVPATLFDCISFKMPFLITKLKCWEDVPNIFIDAERSFILKNTDEFIQYLTNVNSLLVPTIETQKDIYEAL